MFGTALNPTYLITEQWIAKEFVATDLIFIGRRDEDFVGGYKPHIMEMRTLRDILWEDISITDLTDTPNALGTAGQILAMDPQEEMLIWVDPVDTFLDLSDTPTDYTGFEGFNVTVNGTADGLEFTPPVVLTPNYEARLNFNGGSNPSIAQSLVSNLGTVITWSRENTGVYRATFSSVVTPNNLILWIMPSTQGIFTPTVYNSNYIEFEHSAFGGGLIDLTQNQISVEIKLYD
jgi:hypothetical protein